MKVEEVIKQLEENKKNLEFLKTGFGKLDRELDGGFMRKELVVIGGTTGIGKSTISGMILYNMAKQGVKSAYFSLEISNEMVVARLIGAISNIKPTRVLAGLLTKEEFDSKTQAKEKLIAYGDFMTFHDNIYEYSKIEKEICNEKYEFIVIDFIQNIISNGHPDEYSRLSSISLQLQRLAKEANCCILVLSQLSNTAAKSGMKSSVVEYKGAGTIAQVCDLGFWVERANQNGSVNEVRMNLRKNRRGFSGISCDLVFKHPGGFITSL